MIVIAVFEVEVEMVFYYFLMMKEVLDLEVKEVYYFLIHYRIPNTLYNSRSIPFQYSILHVLYFQVLLLFLQAFNDRQDLGF